MTETSLINRDDRKRDVTISSTSVVHLLSISTQSYSKVNICVHAFRPPKPGCDIKQLGTRSVTRYKNLNKSKSKKTSLDCSKLNLQTKESCVSDMVHIIG